MIVGYAPGGSFLHRTHPFTPFALAAATVVWAFALPPPAGPVALTGALAALGLAARLPRVLAGAFLMATPFWVFLLLIHWAFGDDPLRAVTVGAQITALLVAFLLVIAVVHPARLVDALVARRVPFAAAYVLAATLQAVPRLRDRARAILDAQRCRGLRVRGSVWRRARAVIPLALPLVLGALAEVEERALALEARGAGAVRRRTPLDPPHDTVGQRVLRWVLLAGAVAAVALRVAA